MLKRTVIPYVFLSVNGSQQIKRFPVSCICSYSVYAPRGEDSAPRYISSAYRFLQCIINTCQ